MICDQCGRQHQTRHGGQACAGHKSKARGGAACTNAPLTGLEVCRYHGGAPRQVRAAGKRNVTEANARAMAARWSVPIQTTPTEALLGRVSAYAGHVAFYREQVQKLDVDDMVFGITRQKVGGDDHGTTYEAKPNIWITLYNEASDRLAKFAAEALKAGVEERKVRLAESQGRLVADVIRGVLADLGLSDEQQQAAPEVVVRHLRLLAS
jgi:hypothetical protein